MLDGLDALVFDVQDAGVRFYTYITTMGYAMEAAARKGLSFMSWTGRIPSPDHWSMALSWIRT